ncbi:hypothetical protein CYY_002677 [Polysphondylium violaceum]|uniref:Proteasome activator complex subunit 4 n=1 Tax=Polysphondylium violaceum TaxID=133409 RepID=A0A8J4Q0V3_9MYCE|nr:hypothetical protein CYY_002677 [Polysphondylium violaceum]
MKEEIMTTNPPQSTINSHVSFDLKDFEQTAYGIYKKSEYFKSKNRSTNKEILETYRTKTNYLIPPKYKDDVEESDRKMFQDTMKCLDWSVAVGDLGGVKKAIKQFRHLLLYLGYPFLKEDYHHLIDVFFSLFYQYRQDTPITSFLTLLLLRGKKVIELSIEWRPLYEVFSTLNAIDPYQRPVSVMGLDNSKFVKILNLLIINSKPFFNAKSESEIRQQAQLYFVPHSNHVFFGVHILSYFLPTHHMINETELPKWLEEHIKNTWTWIEFTREWDERWISLFSRIIKHSPLIDFNPLLPLLYSNIVRIFDLAVASSSMEYLKPAKQKIPESFSMNNNEPKYEYTCIGKALAYLLPKHDKNDINLVYFKNFMTKFSVYFHPSNQGSWSEELIEFVASILFHTLKRNLLKPFDQDILLDIVETVFPSLINILYSKKKHNILSICKMIKELAYVLPNFVFSKIIDKFYNAIDKEEINRLISGIEVISTCLHPMITHKDFPEGKTHVYNFMELNIKSIDPIYPNKASAAFKFFNRLFSCVILNNENNYKLTSDDEFLVSTTMSTASFLDWSLLFVDKVLDFILQASTKNELSGKKREMPPGVFLRETLETFFCQTSDEIYDAILKRLLEFFTKTFEPDYYKQFGEFLKASTFRNPVKSISTILPMLIGKILYKHDHKYHIRDLNEQEYKWYISLIGYLLYKGNSGLIEFQDTLIEIFNVLLSSNNKVIIKETSKVIRKLIFSLSRYYPNNNRSVPLDIFNLQENHIEFWGTTDKEYVKNIEWFQPGEKEIEFTRILIDKYLNQRCIQFKQYIETLKPDEKNNNFDRMKILNELKIIHNIIRSSTFILQDSSAVTETHPTSTSFRYQLKYLHPEHGQIFIQSFNHLKESIFYTIHSLLSFIESNKNEEVSILKQISKLYNVLFFGKSDIMPKTSTSLFDKWKNHKQLKTRNIFVFKSHHYHLNRQKLYFNSLKLTAISRDAIFDLFRLSTHRYREVRIQGQTSLSTMFSHYPSTLSEIMPLCMDRLMKLNSDEEVKGIVHLMGYNIFIKKLRSNWTFLKNIVPFVFTPIGNRFKTTTRETFDTIKNSLLSLAVITPIQLSYSQDMINGHSKVVTAEILNQAKEFIDKKSNENINSLDFLIHKFIEIYKTNKKTDGFNWEDHFSVVLFLFLITAMLIEDINVHRQPILIYEKYFSLVKETFSVLLDNFTSDHSVSRIISLNYFSYFGEKNHLTDNYRELVFEKFYGQEYPRANNEYTQKISEKLALSFKPILTEYFIKHPNRLEQILKLMAMDHEDSIGSTFSSEISKKRINTFWPNTRNILTSTSSFKIYAAKLFHSCFLITNGEFFETIKPHIEILKTKTDKEDVYLLAEILAGLGRFVCGIDFEKRDQVIQYMSKILINNLALCSNEATEIWATCIRYMCNGFKYERICWLTDCLFTNYYSPTNILSTSKSLRFIKALLLEVAWRSEFLLHKTLTIVKEEFSKPYKQIRDEAQRLLFFIIIYESNFQVYPPITKHESIDFVKSLLLQLEDPDLALETKNSIKDNLCSFIHYCTIKGSFSVLHRISPLLIKYAQTTVTDKVVDISKHALICNYKMSLEFYLDHSIIDSILNTISTYTINNTSWKVRSSVSPFLQLFFFNHSFYLNQNQIDTIIDMVLTQIKDSQIEVREHAKTTLASILISYKNPKTIETLISNSIKNLKDPKITNNEKHSNILILSAIILSSPYSIPQYFPQVLEQLAIHANAGNFRSTASATISEFWRTHKDSWEEDIVAFNDDQIESMRSTIVSPSYFA